MSASEITPLSFYRNYVARNKPVLISGAIDGWPALQNWSPQYISERMGNAQVCSQTSHYPLAVNTFVFPQLLIFGSLCCTRSQWR